MAFWMNATAKSTAGLISLSGESFNAILMYVMCANVDLGVAPMDKTCVMPAESRNDDEDVAEHGPR